jgi:hypothetical protein
MSVKQVKTTVDAVVNYTYYLSDSKILPELERLLFKYSFIKNREHGFIINIHCNENFKKLCEELEIVPDNFIPLEEDPDIDFKIFWAYHKIKVYDKCPVGEWHLDIDAVFKELPFYRDCDLQVAYLDETPVIPFAICIPKDYKIPPFAKGTFQGFNMSALCFHSQELKDFYCKSAIDFMRSNKDIINDCGWQHMVYVEQSFIKQICEYYDYSYKFINTDIDYYHLGEFKKIQDEEEKNKTLTKLKKLLCLHMSPQV